MRSRPFVAILAAAACVLAGVQAAQAGSPPPAAGMQSLPGRLTELRHDPNPSDHRVGPPLEYLLQEKGLLEKASTFTVNYLPAGSTATGQTCITWPDAAKAAFTYAVNVWASLLQSSVPITVDACWSTSLGANTLGSAGPSTLFRDFPGAAVAGTWYAIPLANALAGSDLNGATAEIRANFNSTFTWYFGTDGAPPFGQTDFASVVMHEVGHGLGFLGSMEVDTSTGQGSWGLSGFPIAYDRFTENGAGQALINTSVFGNPSAALGATLTSNAVFFDGASASGANGGSRVPLYAPATWNDGSSYSHLAESFNATVNALMTFSLASGESVHHPGPVTLGILKDSGWSVQVQGGTFTLTVAKSGNGAGTVTSSPGGINCGSSCSASFTTNTVVTLTAAATAGSTFTGWSDPSCPGTGTCTLTLSASRSVTATFSSSSSSARLVNISTRGRVETGVGVMIGGFVIGGSVPKKVLVTARGPSLAGFGVTGVLSDPMLTLFSGQTVVAANDDWQENTNRAEILALGVFPNGLAPSSDVESALLVTLSPGAYTAVVEGLGGVTGVGIVEVFELDQPAAEVVNISTRGSVQTGNNVMIGGFVISGTTPRTVLITARGPSLAAFGVTGALADPTLELYSGQALVASNDNWAVSSNASAIFATGLAPTNQVESAMLVTLNPGAYTAIVRGASGGTGVAIVEVFAR